MRESLLWGLALVSLSAVTGCSAEPIEVVSARMSRDALLSVGYDRGLLGGHGLLLLPGGELVYIGLSRERPTALMLPADRAKLLSYLESDQFRALLELLQTDAYAGNRRDDGMEVYVSYGGANLGYSVCTSGPNVHELIKEFTHRIDSLGRQYFPGRYIEDLPTTTCTSSS